MQALAAIERCEQLDEVTLWARQAGDPFPVRFPDMSEEEAWRRSSIALEAQRMLAVVDRGALPDDLRDTLALADHMAQLRSEEGAWYWTVFDPTRSGLFTMFAATPFGGSYMLNMAAGALEAFRFDAECDVDLYTALIADLARVVEQFIVRTTGQAERGIFMPIAQLNQSRLIVAKLAQQIPDRLRVSKKRLSHVDGQNAALCIDRRIGTELLPSLTDLGALLEQPDFAHQAPHDVGLAQYPAGREIYAALLKRYSTLDTTPEIVHQAGLERMEQITGQIEELLSDLGFSGRFEDFRAKSLSDPLWHEPGADGLVERFDVYVQRAGPMLGSNFTRLPEASCVFEPLPEAAAGSITFGYYNPPTQGRAEGVFRFNARNLGASPLFTMASLTYHEVVPGHHLQIALQHENRDMPRFRRNAFITAYAEGWAEYAATLAGEAGLYAAPQERLGRLMMDAMLTCRLVVDTGMNVLGWSLDQARDFMRANGFITEAEIASESLRYSCDIPGQALVYKLGDAAIMAMREEARAELGDRFDIMGFHETVLAPGPLPFPVIQANVRAWTGTKGADL
jgi:uncharacterized protein (DUF885 family)